MNLSPCIQKLINDGFNLEIVHKEWMLIKNVPYLDVESNVNYGIIVSKIQMAGDTILENPIDHTIYFAGKQPYRIDGVFLNPNNSNIEELYSGFKVNFYYSYKINNRPYLNHYEKMSHYFHMFSKHAIKKDPNAIIHAGMLNIIPEKFPFKYSVCNSASPESNNLLDKFIGMKIGIIGLGGTGSYILDYISKTPVAEIHLIDGDHLLNKNAFRSPGATSIDDLRNIQKKTDYFKKEYDQIHSGIISHPVYINNENKNILDNLSFVFISIDRSNVKRIIVEYLEEKNIDFIDVGMGVKIVDGAALCQMRTTLSTKNKRDHIREKNRIKFEENDNNEYSKLPQIAELNALNAAFAVIKWKKVVGFYHDQDNEHHSQYILPQNKILNNDR